ncbi:MAG: hypothetical protein IJT62_00775 [Oscillospiraceae bacterium]|nr:hypothetical protein [Oscillospiraceae bacterium]
MDKREYLKRLFADKKVKAALAVILVCCAGALAAAFLVEDRVWGTAAQIGCVLVVFSRLPVISSTAMAIASELEKKKK